VKAGGSAVTLSCALLLVSGLMIKSVVEIGRVTYAFTPGPVLIARTTLEPEKYATDGVLSVRVEDTGRGLAESAGAGLGLANIEARLAAMFGDAGALSLEPNKPAGVVARIDLPLRFVAAMNETGDVRVFA